MNDKFKDDIENSFNQASEKILNELRNDFEIDRNRFNMRIGEGFKYSISESEKALAKYAQQVKDISDNVIQAIPLGLSAEYHTILTGLMEDYNSKINLLAQEKFGTH